MFSNQVPRTDRLDVLDLPFSAVRAARRLYYGKMRSPEADPEAVQAKTFEALGWDYPSARTRLEAVLRDINLPSYDEGDGMTSQHWLAFAALSYSAGPHGRLLEIGTYDARFTSVLASLFPDWSIITCDLPSESQMFVKTYGRGPRLELFLTERNERLACLANVQFIECDSFELPRYAAGPFDLAWVDGGHDYPEIAWDAAYVINSLAGGGSALFDDLFLGDLLPLFGRKLVPDFNDSGALIESLAQRGLLEVIYIDKRIAGAGADPLFRKHVAVCRGTAEANSRRRGANG